MKGQEYQLDKERLRELGTFSLAKIEILGRYDSNFQIFQKMSQRKGKRDVPLCCKGQDKEQLV